jgi:uncharacterized protein YecE (DUF72 family)
MASLYIGTPAFTASGWEGSFYPEGTKSADFLRYYAQHFNSVEVDSSFYRIPSASTVRGWASKTPAGFVFAAKVPQVITHEKVLVDCFGLPAIICLFTKCPTPPKPAPGKTSTSF